MFSSVVFSMYSILRVFETVESIGTCYFIIIDIRGY